MEARHGPMSEPQLGVVVAFGIGVSAVGCCVCVEEILSATPVLTRIPDCYLFLGCFLDQ